MIININCAHNQLRSDQLSCVCNQQFEAFVQQHMQSLTHGLRCILKPPSFRSKLIVAWQKSWQVHHTLNESSQFTVAIPVLLTTYKLDCSKTIAAIDSSDYQ